MKRSDFHVHTGIVSRCARPESTVAAYLNLCVEEGVSAIGFADHLWDTRVCTSRVYDKNTFEDLQKIYGTIPKDRKGVQVFVGCETDMNAYGEIGIAKETAAQLDFVLIPISHYHNQEVQFLGIDIDDAQFMRKYAIHRFIKACEADLPVPTVVCHPFMSHGTKSRDIMMQAITDNDYLQCFRYAAEKNILIEIHYTVCSDGWEHYEDGFSVESLRMLSLAREAGCKFTFGTDSHWPSMFGGGIHARMEDFAKRCGITDEKIVSEFPKNNKNV